MIVYVSVGNDGERLSQPRWAQFAVQAEGLLIGKAGQIRSAWYSMPTAPGQSACWRIRIPEDTPPIEIMEIKAGLADVASRYGQEVTWEEVGRAETLAG